MSDEQNGDAAGGPDKGWNKPAVPDDDTEGHMPFTGWSNKDLKKDVKPIQPAPADDTEGHMPFTSWSNKDLKKDVKPIKGKTS